MSAASLYLSLSALGLSLTVEVAPEHADGHTIKVRGLGLMDSVDRERIRRLIRANKAELVALLTSERLTHRSGCAPGGLLREQHAKPGGGRMIPVATCLHAGVDLAI